MEIKQPPGENDCSVSKFGGMREEACRVETEG